MVLNRSNGALAGALALMMVGCAADAADQAHDVPAYDPEDAPVQALVVYDDVTSADQGSARTSGSSSSGSRASSSSSSTSSGDVTSAGSAGSTGSGRASTTTPSTGLWNPTSVANLCFFARDPRAAVLCRVTLTDCTKPAAPLDAFTQILCQLRGFLPGGASNGGSSSAAAPSADAPATAPTGDNAGL